MTHNPQEDKVLKIIPKDDILTDILMLAITIVVIGAILVFVAPDFTETNNGAIPVIHTPLYGSNDTLVVNTSDSIVITFAPKTPMPLPIPKTIGECSPEAISLMNNFIANDVGNKSDGYQYSGIHIALLMCEYIQANYEYTTGTVCLWYNSNGYIDHAQTWVEINNEKYIIETLFNTKDNRIYNVSEHKRIWDDRYKIQFTSLEKGYEHHKKYVEGGLSREPQYRLRRIANEEHDVVTISQLSVYPGGKYNHIRTNYDDNPGIYLEVHNDVVFVMDISASTFSEIVVDTGVTFLDYEKALMIDILDDKDFKDDRVGMVAFGGKAYEVSGLTYLGNDAARESLKETIMTIEPKGEITTTLDQGLAMAEEMLSNSVGSKDVIIISDGNIDMGIYESSRSVAARMNNADTRMHFIHVMSSPCDMVSEFRTIANDVGDSYQQTEYPYTIYPYSVI